MLALLRPLCEDVAEVFVARLGVMESPRVCVLVVQLDAPPGHDDEVVCACAGEVARTAAEGMMQCLIVISNLELTGRSVA